MKYVDEDGLPLVVEATTSWSFVGAGLRLTMELMGPEYSMSSSTLDNGTKVFLSRRLRGLAGEDLLEKQNAEQGLMPLVGNEYAEYGYEAENRAFVTAFANGVQPELNFHAGRDVTELLMTCYMSAEQGRVIPWKPDGLASYVPPVARAPERRSRGADTQPRATVSDGAAPWRAGGRAHDERVRQGHRHRVLDVAAQDVEQQPHRGLAQLAHRLPDRRQRRVEVLREPDVVEADDRDVVGHGQPALPHGVEHADGHLVVEAEDAGGRPRPAEQLLARGDARLDREVAAGDGDRHARAVAVGPGHRPLHAIAAERAGHRAGDDADVAVSQLAQVIHGLEGRLGVVDVHARHAQARAELAAVHHRRLAVRQRPHQARRRLRQPVAEEDQAVGFAALQHERVLLLALLVVLGVAEQHRIPGALRGALDALQDHREERVGDVGHGDQQLAGAQRAQALGGGVGGVAQRVDGLHDRRPGGGVDELGPGQHPRHGGRRDPGFPCHVANRRHWRHVQWLAAAASG